MANTKTVQLDWSASGKTVYVVLRREVDDYILDNTVSGSFTQPSSSPLDVKYCTAMIEDTLLLGRYILNESRQVWDDGLYTGAIYLQSGGSPSPTADRIIGSWAFDCVNDSERISASQESVNAIPTNPVLTNDVRIGRLDETISSRSTLQVADVLGALTTQGYTSTRASYLDVLNGIVSAMWSYSHRELTTFNFPVTAIPTTLGNGVIQQITTIIDNSNIMLFRGDVQPINFFLGSSVAKAGAKYYFCVKSDRTDDNSSAIINRVCDITDYTNIYLTITPTSDETALAGIYYAEIERRDADDTTPLTVWSGSIIITQDVRQ